jgi:hypothetical protein
MRRGIPPLGAAVFVALLAVAAAAPGRATGSKPSNVAANPTVCIEASSTPGGQIGTRRNPAPIERTVPVGFRGNQFDVTVTEVVTGQEALNRLKEANQFNEPPPEGSEYVLFFSRAHITKTAGDEAVFVSDFDWSMVDSTGKIERPPAVVEPDPQFTGNGFEGATIEGWNTFTRRVGEQVSLVFGLQTPQGAGGAWFAVPGQ